MTADRVRMFRSLLAIALASAPAFGQEPTEPKLPEPKPPEPKTQPWRLDRALGTPEWLKLSGHMRGRYEVLSDQVRTGFSGRGDLFVLRTSLRADVNFAPFEGTFEMLDSRVVGQVDESTSINSGIVNQFEILQAYGALRGDVFTEDGEGFVQLGRHTMDVGSRRLVARNRFRNTINAFDGLNATYEDESTFMRAFFVLPVRRLRVTDDDPNDIGIELDDSTSDVRFWGLFGSTKNLLPSVAGELYYFDLDESDEEDAPTRNRQLGTFGGRVFRAPKVGGVDFELEAAYQFGESRASASPSDTTDLDHSAHFEHAALGYTFDARWKPRLLAQFDYVSGDRDPNDDENNRFETLFGARRFEFGPTGVFGAFARGNIITPGLRLFLKPSDRVRVMAAARTYYLASDTDAWVGTGVRDATGQSGDHLGEQIEIRVRWDAVPQNLLLEVGAAHTFLGEFSDNAPNATGDGDPTYGYVQATLTF